MGSLDYPFNPVSVALGAEATFVARSIDNEREHLADMLSKAATHQGTAFIEIYQNCNIFNDGAFDAVRKNRPQQIRLEHGQPIRFGADNEYGVALKRTGQLEIVRVRASDSEPAGGESNRVRASDSEPAGGESNRAMDTVDEDALLVHDAHRDDPGLAFMLSRLAHTPHGPTPIGLFRQVERPVYGTELNRQLDQAVERRGKGDLATLLAGSDSWTVAG
jgi:2-oxoglutarate ferredoxin oxidoreductase subunit beta